MFGTLLLSVVFTNVILASCGVYLATGLCNVVVGGVAEGHYTAGLFGVLSLLLSVFTILSLVNFHRLGQLMADAYRS